MQKKILISQAFHQHHTTKIIKNLNLCVSEPGECI